LGRFFMHITKHKLYQLDNKSRHDFCYS